jgi:hypothetical protein
VDDVFDPSDPDYIEGDGHLAALGCLLLIAVALVFAASIVFLALLL